MSGLKGRLIGNNLNFLLSELYRNNAHLGDFTTTWNKDLVLFIYGLHNYHCIFDLRLTALYLRRMLNVLSKLGSYGVCAIFVSSNAKLISENTVMRLPKHSLCQIQYACGLWIPGSLTNWFYPQIKQPAALKMTDSAFNVPSVAFFFDTGSYNFAIKEAVKLDLITRACVDSDFNLPLSSLNYFMPVNDDSSGTSTFILNLCLSALIKGERNLFKAFLVSRKKLTLKDDVNFQHFSLKVARDLRKKTITDLQIHQSEVARKKRNRKLNRLNR